MNKSQFYFFFQDAIQAQLVIQKMSELSTQESSDDLDPISEGSPSKTLDEDKHESSSENDETLDDDEDDNETNQDVQAETNFQNNDNTLDTANANLQITDNQNNIPVSIQNRRFF